jgi:shikimate kinase
MKEISKIITFIGFQASGKTTLGQRLAQHLQRRFIDTDRLIEQFHPPLFCCEIFKTFGAAHFRKLESQVIASLTYDSPSVLATGGGSLLQESNGFTLKANGILIYLKTSPEILKERIWQRPNLPGYLNSNNPHETFDRIYQERSAIYEKWADYTILMDGLNIEQAIESIKQI